MEQRRATGGPKESALSDPLVVAIVLNWNRLDDTAECVASLLASTYRHLEILVVDNGSADGSVAALRERFPDIVVLVNDRNLGFAAGNNVGIHEALRRKADYVLLLNNDTVADPGMVTELVAAGEGDEETGVVVPKIYYYGSEQRIWSVGAHKRWLPPRITVKGLNKRETAALEDTVPLIYATACAMAIKRPVLEIVGLLDEGYFMYSEDYDYCERVRKAGLKLACAQRARLWHKVASSTAQSPGERWFYLACSSVRFYRKHWRPAWPLLAVFSAWVIGRECVKGNVRSVGPYLHGLLHGLRSVRHGLEGQGCDPRV